MKSNLFILLGIFIPSICYAEIDYISNYQYQSLQKHYIQLSSVVTQSPGTTSPHWLLLMYKMKYRVLAINVSSSPGSITVNKKGVYFLIAGGQVGKTGAGGTTLLDMWFRKNGIRYSQV